MKQILLHTILPILLFTLTTKLSAQIWLEDGAIYNEAEGYLLSEEYEEALPLYQLLEKKKVQNSNISYKIGRCYLNIEGKKNRAIPYFESAVQNTDINLKTDISETKAPIDAFYLLAIAYRINFQLEKAIKSFNNYRKLTESEEVNSLVEYQITLCENARTLRNFPSSSKLILVRDAANYTRYNPIFTASDNIYFMEKRPFYDAIMFGRVQEDSVTVVTNITPQIKSDGNHFLLCVDHDEKTMLLKAYEAEFGYELYASHKDKNGKWDKVHRFSEPINSPYNETFASLSADGQTLYFCSNRAGGRGGSDIYLSHKGENGLWEEPKNIGAVINTPFNEGSVFISRDDSKLYFSSEGHLNMGGSDLFVSIKKEDGKWMNPINLGSPISTTDNDNFISTTSAENEFYMHRLTENAEQLRMYKVVLDSEVYKNKVVLNGKLNFSENLPPRQVNYIITNVNSKRTTYEAKTNFDGEFSCLLEPGEYKIDYQYNENISANQLVTVTDQQVVNKQNLNAPVWEITEETEVSKDKVVISIRDVLFEFDSDRIPELFYGLLDSIALVVSKNRNLRLSIQGHTDAKGSSQYNLLLSRRRAMAVEQYFISRGIEKKRISSVGKGENNPIAININGDGSDNSEGRSFNRRVIIDVSYNGSEVHVDRIELVPEELKLK